MLLSVCAKSLGKYRSNFCAVGGVKVRKLHELCGIKSALLLKREGWVSNM